MPTRIRQLSTKDSLEDLTALLHRAYASLASRGLRALATWQTVEITRQRLEGAHCLVAEIDGRIVGTILYYDPANTNGSPWYDRPDVANFSQFAVEPTLQRAGIGTALMNAVEERARAEGVAELALDTAEPAKDLIAFYEKRGYRFIEYTQGPGNYRSVLLSKSLREPVKLDGESDRLRRS